MGGARADGRDGCRDLEGPLRTRVLPELRRPWPGLRVHDGPHRRARLPDAHRRRSAVTRRVAQSIVRGESTWPRPSAKSLILSSTSDVRTPNLEPRTPNPEP